MKVPYFDDGQVTLHLGDALEVAQELPSESINCIVTSPPYYGLRDYGQDGQYGLEASPAEYVQTMRCLFAELRRVLAADGTLWLNVGDSYSVRWGSERRTGRRGYGHDADRGRSGAIAHDIPEKNLLGIPWRLAFALQDDGWILRNSIVWSKPNAMPESVTDRLTNRHENLFLLTRSRRYWFDLDPIREPVVYAAGASALNWARESKGADVPGQRSRQHRTERSHGKASATNLAPTGERHLSQSERGRNPGDVWTIPTVPFPGAHFAVMPPALADRCLLSGCKPGGVVLDPSSGSGTTGLAAARHGRRYIGIDLNREYLDLSLRTRLAQTALIDGGAA